ncbi:MAG: hypothetical protein JW984_14560 [Deltaproteobacteria bacterium]|uniref:Uncharacterized protein n=1 Tax=Candidatus Zymogenus saltonus TaxID=2844893 RepID=A0A9D8KH16_9DELT|nr:hypothetical protein [Candidatus Zymogenus saltonus]
MREDFITDINKSTGHSKIIGNFGWWIIKSEKLTEKTERREMRKLLLTVIALSLVAPIFSGCEINEKKKFPSN